MADYLSILVPPEISPRGYRTVHFDRPISQNKKIGIRFDSKYSEKRRAYLLAWMIDNPHQTKDQIRAALGIRKSTLVEYLDDLKQRGMAKCLVGFRRKQYWSAA